MKLLIANKTYSSWSLRPWLLMKQAGIAFDEQKLSFNQPNFAAKVAEWSPAGKVPVLVDGEITVWDSLAICEYLAEKFPEKHLWPEDRAARALARSVSAEMHAGFPHLRSTLTMNCTARFPSVLVPVATQKDVDRVVAIWTDCRARFGRGGPFLFGAFTVADAFFAPVVTRFTTYGVALPEIARAYHDAMNALPALREWIADATREHDFFEKDEPYRMPPDSRAS